MRLRNGILKKISKISDTSVQYLSDMAAARKRPSREKAIILESACKKLGLDVPKELWMFGTSDEIKTALSQRPDRRSGINRRKCERRKGERRECDVEAVA